MTWKLELKGKGAKSLCLTDTVCSARSHKGSPWLQEGVGPGKNDMSSFND